MVSATRYFVMPLSEKWSSETERADHEFDFLSFHGKFLWTYANRGSELW